MKVESRRVTWIILALIVLGPMLFMLLWQAKDKGAVRRYKNQLRAMGEKLTINELLANQAAPDNNSASIASTVLGLYRRRAGTGLLDTNEPRGMRLIAPGKAVIGWAQPAIIGEHATNSWEEELTALANESPPEDWLEQIIAHPALDFRLDYHSGFNILLTHLAPLKRSVSLLAMGTLGDLHQAETAAAVTKVRAILATAHGMRNERLVISQLVRIAITHIGMQATWELLQSTNITDQQLAAVQQDWERLEFAGAYRDALLMERAWLELRVDELRNSSARFRQNANSIFATTPAPASGSWVEQAGNFALLKAKETAWNYAWSYPDELRTLKGFQVLLDSSQQAIGRRPYFAILSEQEQRLAGLGIHPSKDDEYKALFELGDFDLRNLISSSILSVSRGLNRIEITEVARSLTIGAIAVTRYRLRHGSLPADLASLSPEIFAAVPRDPIDGKPLRYRLNQDGSFVLYSVGDDGVDNGGDPSRSEETKTFSWQKGRDWVWPQPANAEELEAYYKTLNDPKAKIAVRYGVPAQR